MSPRRRFVCFGSSRVSADDPAAGAAREVGGILAERGIAVVSGGYSGAMGAVSEGARSAGGEVIGVTTGIFADRAPNQHLTAVYSEPDYPSRLATLCRQGHGFVALPGGLGTLSEWTTIWCLMTIDQAPGPLYLFADPWKPVFEAIMSLPEVAEDHLRHLHWLNEAEDLARALDAASGRS